MKSGIKGNTGKNYFSSLRMFLSTATKNADVESVFAGECLMDG